MVKDWKKLVFPLIRPKDKKTGKPKVGAAGVVIYRGMVNHKQFKNNKAYQVWEKGLYPDPPEKVRAADSPAYPTIEQRCKDKKFKAGLYNRAMKKINQSKGRREESKLEEIYAEIMGESRLDAEDEDEEDDAMAALMGGGDEEEDDDIALEDDEVEAEGEAGSKEPVVEADDLGGENSDSDSD
jgi:hypothetical protein